MQITEFLALAQHHLVLDVRSPGEYAHACIPGALSFPLFTDEERKVVGTTYKQHSREDAIKIGLDYFGPKMRAMVQQVEDILATRAQTIGAPAHHTVLVHCWRGGMRSAAIAWLLDLYGFKVCTLAGGYKAFRHWALAQLAKPYNLRVLGGYTGSGKTELLAQLAASGRNVVDLESIARHKGSAFGAMGQGPQPSQEMFENNLAVALSALPPGEPVWVEDESRRIGNINLPAGFWAAMRTSQLYFLDIPAEARLQHIVAGYGRYRKEELVANIMRIRKRLGGLATRESINCLIDDDVTGCFRILLRYYDKFYAHGLQSRDGGPVQITTIQAPTVNAPANAASLIMTETTNKLPEK